MLAEPLTKATAEPKFEPSMTNWTEPVGKPEPLTLVLVTVAVKVTDWPKAEGLTDELTAVLMESALTVG